jgi:hypothetical protein
MHSVFPGNQTDKLKPANLCLKNRRRTLIKTQKKKRDKNKNYAFSHIVKHG